MSSVSSIYWEMTVNNKKIEGDTRACINNILIDELCDGSDTCTIDITDPDFIFIEDDIFIDDASVHVKFGFNEDTDRQEFNGYISAIDISFPEEGSPTLTITCLDESHVMNREDKSKTWEKKTRADVVREIAQSYGFKTDIESGYNFKTEESISQSKQTDIEFLESLAGQEREPFMCKLVKDTIVYKKKGVLQTPVTTVGYKTFPFDVISFNPQITKETRQESITDADVGATTKTTESHTANDENTERDVQGLSMSGPQQANMYYDSEKRQWVKIFAG